MRVPQALMIPFLCAGLLAAQEAAPKPAAQAEPAKPAPQDPEPVDSAFSKAYVREVWRDGKETLSAPAHWEGPEWRTAGFSALAVVGTALLLDRPARDAAVRNRTPGRDRVARDIEPFGETAAAGVVGAFYLYGAAAGDSEAKHVAMDAFAASLIASGILAPAFKFAVGRERPGDSGPIDRFQPFHAQDPSFPSNHATEAFAVASVISAHYDSPWAGGIAYGVAGLVGLARLEQNQHYASDVVAGALLGAFVGRKVVALNRPGGHQQVTVSPYATPEARGVAVAWTF
ncbi:MAG TPA: phosphatase PAP2 family protein [Holophagaceae bacterium]|nr:phosphatase PAP2 family protein [Holophagaceae bacterium]